MSPISSIPTKRTIPFHLNPLNTYKIRTCISNWQSRFLLGNRHTNLEGIKRSKKIDLIWILVFNATFSSISAISWRPVLFLEKTGVPKENHRPWSSNWYTLSLAAESRVYPFCNLQSWVRTQAVLEIGLNELLGNPTT